MLQHGGRRTGCRADTWWEPGDTGLAVDASCSTCSRGGAPSKELCAASSVWSLERPIFPDCTAYARQQVLHSSRCHEGTPSDRHACQISTTPPSPRGHDQALVSDMVSMTRVLRDTRDQCTVCACRL